MERAPGIENELAVRIDDQPAQHGEVGAHQAEKGESRPAVADHQKNRRAGEQKIGGHGERADRVDGGPDVGERDGEEAEDLRLLPLGEQEDVNRPEHEEKTGDERTLDDAIRVAIAGRIGGEIEPGQGHRGDGAAKEKEGRPLRSRRSPNIATPRLIAALKPNQALRPQQVVNARVGPTEDQRQGEYAE